MRIADWQGWTRSSFFGSSLVDQIRIPQLPVTR